MDTAANVSLHIFRYIIDGNYQPHLYTSQWFRTSLHIDTTIKLADTRQIMPLNNAAS